MGIDITALRKKLEDHRFRWNHAKSNGIKVMQETEVMRNILLNNLDEIIDALKIAESADEQVKMLEAEVASADAELKELDDEIKRLRAEADKSAKGKRVK